MNTIRFIYNKKPTCKTCGKDMEEWDPFLSEGEQEHDDCIKRRIVEEMMEEIKERLFNYE